MNEHYKRKILLLEYPQDDPDSKCLMFWVISISMHWNSQKCCSLIWVDFPLFLFSI